MVFPAQEVRKLLLALKLSTEVSRRFQPIEKNLIISRTRMFNQASLALKLNAKMGRVRQLICSDLNHPLESAFLFAHE